MATIFEWDSGALATAGATVNNTVNVVADTGFDRAVMPQSSATDSFSWPSLSLTMFTMRAYITMPSAWASVSAPLMCSQIAGGIQNSRMNLAGTGNPGQVRLIAHNNTQVAQSANSLLSFSTVYRWEMQVDTVNSTIRGAVFPLGSDTPVWDSGLINHDVGGTTVQLRFGKAVSSIPSLPEISISRVKAVDTVGSWVGRHASDTMGGDPEDPGSSIALWEAAEAQSSALLGVWNGTGVDLIETGSEIWVWHYDWTNDQWTTPPATRPAAEVTRVLASGPTEPPTDDYPDWMGDSPLEWAEGKAIVHYLWADEV